VHHLFKYILLLKHALILKRYTVGLLLGYLWMMYPARGGLDWGQMRGYYPKSRGSV